MLIRHKHFAAFAFCLSLIVVNAIAQEKPRAETQFDEYGRWKNGVTEPWFFESKDRYIDEEVAAARKIWNEIATDEAGDEWAGTYRASSGEVNASYFRWSPKHGFVSFDIYTCLPDVRHLDYGKANVFADGVEFISMRASKVGRGDDASSKYIKVKWGEQRHLIAEHHVSNFCDYVAGRGAYNKPEGFVDDEFLSHLDDEGKPTVVLPTVPPAYREYVRQPIDARITKVGKSYVEVDPENEWSNDLVTPVTINAGSNQGLKRGMMLDVLSSDIDEKVEITRVGSNSAGGIIVRSVHKRPGVRINEWDDGIDEPQQPILAGWQLTTSEHKRLLRLNERAAAWEAKQKKQ